jgi:hypothetical protein
MNNTEISATERLSKPARGLADKEALNNAGRRFPSYVCVFGNFFQLCAAKLYAEAVQPFAVCWMRFSVAILSVAFV